MSVDASNCFDRVAHPTVGMACQHFGLPLDGVVNFFDTIQNMKMHLMIAYGLSINFFSGQDLPFQGLMQGNGAASLGFLLIAIILFKCLHHKKLISESMLPITNRMHSLAGKFFVDDSECSVTSKGNESELQIASRSQKSLGTWHGGLQFAGGELKLKTCYWTMQSFKWKDGLPKLVIEQKQNLPINLDGTPQPIPYLSPNKMRILVGVVTNPSNESKNTLNLIQQKMQGCLATLISRKLSPSVIMEGYEKFWWLSLKLIVPTLMLEHAHNILNPFCCGLLPRIKINRRIPSALIPLPFFMGGLKLRCL